MSNPYDWPAMRDDLRMRRLAMRVTVKRIAWMVGVASNTVSCWESGTEPRATAYLKWRDAIEQLEAKKRLLDQL